MKKRTPKLRDIPAAGRVLRDEQLRLVGAGRDNQTEVCRSSPWSDGKGNYGKDDLIFFD